MSELKEVLNFFVMDALAGGVEETQDGGYIIGSVLIFSGVIMALFVILISPIWIPLYAFGWLVSKLSRLT